MKPFNLERAIAGDPMVFKSGQAPYDIAWHPMKRRFVGQVHQYSYSFEWDENGIMQHPVKEKTDHYDLMMVSRTVTSLIDPDTLTTGVSSENAYYVEARRDIPKIVDGQIISQEWKRLTFPEGPIGVPMASKHAICGYFGYYSYHAAEALRYWFLASADDDGVTQTRLVVVRIETTHSITKTGIFIN